MIAVCAECGNVEGTPHELNCLRAALEGVLDRFMDGLGVNTVAWREARHKVVRCIVDTVREHHHQSTPVPPGYATVTAWSEHSDPYEALVDVLSAEGGTFVGLTREAARAALALVSRQVLVEDARGALVPKHADPAEKLDEPDADEVDGPAHYGGASDPYEAIKVMLAWAGTEAVVAFCRLNAVKYLARADKKGSEGVDLRKAAWYARTAALLLEEGKLRPDEGSA